MIEKTLYIRFFKEKYIKNLEKHKGLLRRGRPKAD